MKIIFLLSTVMTFAILNSANAGTLVCLGESNDTKKLSVSAKVSNKNLEITNVDYSIGTWTNTGASVSVVGQYLSERRLALGLTINGHFRHIEIEADVVTGSSPDGALRYMGRLYKSGNHGGSQNVNCEYKPDSK